MVNRKVEFKSAKLRDELFVNASYEETEIVIAEDEEQETRSTRDVTIKGDAPAHEDLRKAFKQLTYHMLAITEQIGINSVVGTLREADSENNPLEAASHNIEGLMLTDSEWQILCGAECHSFKIDGVGDNERVQLIGHRTLDIVNNSLAITTPSINYGSRYKHTDELAELIEICKSEVYQYAFERKYQPDTQGNLFAKKEQDEELSDVSVEFDGNTIDLKKKGKKTRKNKDEGVTPEGGEDF